MLFYSLNELSSEFTQFRERTQNNNKKKRNEKAPHCRIYSPMFRLKDDSLELTD